MIGNDDNGRGWVSWLVEQHSVLWQKLVGPASTKCHITAVTPHVWLTHFLETELNSPWPLLPFLRSENIYVTAFRLISCSRNSP